MAMSLEELEKALEISESEKDKIIKWDPYSLNKLFDIDWESSQLYSVITDLEKLLGKPDTPSGRGYSIAGGTIVRHLLKTDIFKGDIDIFPTNGDALLHLVKSTQDRRGFVKGKYAHNFPYKLGMRETKVQIIFHKPCGVSSRLENFDFAHCRFSYNFATEDFYASRSAPVHIALRTTSLGNVKEPGYSLIRALKYKKLGFDMDHIIEDLARKVSINSMSKEDAERYEAGDYS